MSRKEKLTYSMKVHEIYLADKSQLEYWFLNLPIFSSELEEIKWLKISELYYLGPDNECTS